MAEEIKKPANNDDGVDKSPISPLERRNSLEKHLQTRPEHQDLKNRHILLDTTAAPALQARAAELERQRITDNLKKGLSKRPEKDELVNKNILGDSRAAPALHEKQRELERTMRKDSLEKAVASRPGRDDLVGRGVLKEGETEEPVAEENK
ncbi:hypothetical protein BDY17DRAFT_321362 [Neohortaea acidophila]|uniref:RPEL repeat protein n=1 Tax=Neohortaea acidophila TaxID=245834 RepID=A0A6A6Q2U9_9PEZI|nr:uncharacterized protein BDY17DRAFT_321362 [Neohortaea acidophila]KAF2486582.1 hypothetical protein BDY17DRAFT_321362 [Neohortaea acidophila]